MSETSGGTMRDTTAEFHLFAELITPNTLVKRYPDQLRRHSLHEWNRLANQPDRICQCGQFYIWKFGECGLCFTCTTGEADAFEDYELTSDKRARHREELP